MRPTASGKRAVVLLFVHGWQNDASQREDRKDDNNVEGFQRLLEHHPPAADCEGATAPTTSP